MEQARQIDQFNITSMDEYAMLLRIRGDHAELNRLVHDMLNIDSTRPEVWVASAVYWEMREDKIRALTFADRVRILKFQKLTAAFGLYHSPAGRC